MPYFEDAKDGLVQPEAHEKHEMEDFGFDPTSREDQIEWRRHGDLLRAEREIEARYRATAESFPGDIAASLADARDHALDRQEW